MNHREKRPAFGFTYIVLGLIIGFFMGSGLVYWYSNRQNDSIFSRNLWDYFAKLFQDQEGPDTLEVYEIHPREPLRAERGTSRPLPLQSDTLNPENTVIPSVNDSLALDSLAVSPEEELTDRFSPEGDPIDPLFWAEESLINSTESIRLVQDSLLAVRAYSLPKQTPETDRDPALRKLDSLLGNYQRRIKTDNLVIVEFWLSPLNFQGYKMSHNKIILYGLDHIESFSLHSDGHSLYVKYFDDFYPVSRTMDFKPLVPIINPGLLEETLER